MLIQDHLWMCGVETGEGKFPGEATLHYANITNSLSSTLSKFPQVCTLQFLLQEYKVIQIDVKQAQKLARPI